MGPDGRPLKADGKGDTALCLALKSSSMPVWAIYALALVGTFAGAVVLWEVLRRIPFVRYCVFGIAKPTKK